jgi:hypothetical protein
MTQDPRFPNVAGLMEIVRNPHRTDYRSGNTPLMSKAEHRWQTAAELNCSGSTLASAKAIAFDAMLTNW